MNKPTWARSHHTKPRQPRQAMRRIIADNDVRNGTVAERLIRMLEQPDREPNADGLYPEVGR